MSDSKEKIRRVTAIARSYGPVERVEQLQGDASTRTYYRAWYPDEGTAIIAVYPRAGCNQELPFLDVHRYLESLELPVPKVYAYIPKEGVLILEDLGDCLLETVAEVADEQGLRQLYEAASDLVIRLQRRTAVSSTDSVALYLAFDQAKLMQEMEFFMMHFVRGACRMEPSAAAAKDLEEFFRLMCTMLAAEPRVFAHRDFHSRNLILHNKLLFMIDFQDARMGPAQYDLVSLLRDSYITLPDCLIKDLIDRYMDNIGRTLGYSKDRFRFVFDIMSLQRNTKALGTFGFQASVKGCTRYVSSIPRTGAYIARTIADIPDFRRFRSVVEDFISGPAIGMQSICNF